MSVEQDEGKRRAKLSHRGSPRTDGTFLLAQSQPDRVTIKTSLGEVR